MDAQETAIIEHAAVCPSCGTPVLAEDVFCEACGHRLADAAPVPAAQPPGAAGQSGPGQSGPAQCTECGATDIDADGYCGHCGLRQPSGRDHAELELAPGGPAGVTDKGLRHPKNEDAMAMAFVPGMHHAVVAVVSDGVSSSPRPEDASRAAADTGVAVLLRELEAGAHPQIASRTALEQAAKTVADLAGAGHDAPACTYVSALLTAGTVTVAWIGDSRAYWVNAAGDGGARLTEDDSWAEQMVAMGAMSEAEAQAHRNAHVLVGWLGADGAAQPHVKSFAPSIPGAVVVCSDGLWNYLPEAEAIAAIFPESGSPLGAAQRLLRVALDGGGHDNITIVVIPFVPQEHGVPQEYGVAQEGR
jgi:serine/threonine protein phosphatase PrpC